MDHDQLVDLIETVLNSYLDQVDPEEIDTNDLAENIAARIENANS
jgi:hypothetical protein